MKKVIAKRENGGVNVRREEPRICKEGAETEGRA
jgi:hypothetical protein